MFRSPFTFVIAADPVDLLIAGVAAMGSLCKGIKCRSRVLAVNR